MHRNSRIELIKIFAIILIILCHSMPDGSIGEKAGIIYLGVATTDISIFIMNYILNLGQIGNLIFIVCSSWFLLENDKVNTKKMIHITGDCTVISILFVIFFIGIGYELPGYVILKQFMPVIYSGAWYVTCYLLFLLILPSLNILIKGMEKQNLLLVNVVLVLLYCAIGFAENSGLFFYSNLIGFIVVYFIVAYIKQYKNNYISNFKSCIILIFTGVACWITLSILLNVLGLYSGFFYYRLGYLNKIINPFFIMIAIGAFGLANRKMSYHKSINWFASMSLLIYMIHCNRIIRDYIRFDIFEYIYVRFSYNNIFIWIFIYAFASFVLGTVGAILYRYILMKPVHRFSEYIADIIRKIYKKVERMILK